MGAATLDASPAIKELVKKSLVKEEGYSEENYLLCEEMIIVGLDNDFYGSKGKVTSPEKEFLLENKSPKYKIRGFIDKPIILHKWCQKVHDEPAVGDQEVLHSMLDPMSKIVHIEDLPNEYNVMRIQVELDGYKGKKKIIHWTGPKGKQRIRSMINE